MRSPSETSKSATVLRSLPWSVGPAMSRARSGPAVAVIPPSTRWTQGTIEP